MKGILIFVACMAFPVLAEQKILPLREGLTLAEVENNRQPQTIAVMHDSNNQIRGVNLSEMLGKNLPPIALYNQFGYVRLRQVIRQTAESDYQSFSYAELKSPAGGGTHHLALGFNYAAHAQEIEQQEKPFMFMKLTMPTREQPITYQANRLLDYEVEICARSLQDIEKTASDTTTFAYFLCGDFTDRALLLRTMDRQNMQNGKGFSESKSLNGYFPTGPYMIIPNSRDAMQNMQLSLWQNGELKQQANARQMIWDTPKFVNKLLDYQYKHIATPVNGVDCWLPANKLTSANTLLTGTPAGVLMQPPNWIFKFTRALQYFFTGNWFGGNYNSVTDYVVEQYLQKAFADKRFLQRGDHVELAATYLGHISVKIE